MTVPIDPQLQANMNAERLRESRRLGVASAIPFTNPQAAADATPLNHTPPITVEQTQVVVPKPALAVVGQTVTGRGWLVLQLPSGGIRAEKDTEMGAREEARRLAKDESGEFGVFQPRGISRPHTTVTDELF